MTSAVFDQNIGDAIIEQTGRGALVQHLTHYFTPGWFGVPSRFAILIMGSWNILLKF